MARISGTNASNTLTGTDCNDTICANGGDDVVNARGGNDLVYGGTGNDYILGGKGNDTLYGEDGNDTLIAGAGFDKLFGGAGNDELHGGGDNDILSGGDGADTIYVDSLGSNCVNNTTVDGGSGGVDNDTLDISGLLAQGWEVVNVVKNPETNGAPGYNGQIQLYNPATHQWANINFTDIEHVPCFTPGTLIATPTGEVAVEALRLGDRVMTRDNGIQEIRWIGQRALSAVELGVAAHLCPVRIAKGALGNGLPERDMLVSPNHRMLIANEKTALYFEEHEVLVAAKHLLGRPGITRAAAADVTYVHFMCDRHEVVLADGAWSESFQPGDLTLGSLARAQREEIFAIFPELKTPVGREGYAAARRTLRKHEAALLRAG